MAVATRIKRVIALDPSIDAEEASAMLELVAKHDVHWEVWPEQAVRGGALRTIGFRIDLHGRHHRPKHHPTPGCDECITVYRALRRLAKFILPKGERVSVYEVQHFDQSLHFDHGAGSGDVVAPIRIVHREGYFEPVNACEVECLQEIEAKLDALGAVGARRRSRAG